jgi:hypothetical protein
VACALSAYKELTDRELGALYRFYKELTEIVKEEEVRNEPKARH